MAQNWFQWFIGLTVLIIDTCIQRFFFGQPPPHPVFTSRTHLRATTAIVTGANSGIGFETARFLAHAGAHVILACRNLQKAQEAANTILSSIPNARLTVMHLDLSSLSSVRAFASAVNDGPLKRVDILILNGGVMGVPSTHPEQHLYLNHVAHALLTLLLLPSLQRAPAARVVFVSSMTVRVSDLRFDDLHFNKRPYHWLTAYANSKLLMILFMRALHTRLTTAGSSITVQALHPGDCSSDVSRHLGSFWYAMHKTFGPYVLLSVEQCSYTSVYVAAGGEGEHHDGKHGRSLAGKVFHRICEVWPLPSHLITDEDVQCAWKTTLNLAEMTEVELRSVRALESTAAAATRMKKGDLSYST